MSETLWHISGEELGACKCDWGCPCQFNANPTHGDCHGLGVVQIDRGHFGEARLDGIRFGFVLSWPGAISDGDGTMQLILDESRNEEQRTALKAIVFAEEGGLPFEIFQRGVPPQAGTGRCAHRGRIGPGAAHRSHSYSRHRGGSDRTDQEPGHGRGASRSHCPS